MKDLKDILQYYISYLYCVKVDPNTHKLVGLDTADDIATVKETNGLLNINITLEV